MILRAARSLIKSLETAFFAAIILSMKVRIYRPSRNTMQSGLGRTKGWVLEPELETPRGPEPLMGWTSSGDTLNQIRLRFDAEEKAVAYAKEKGWEYTVQPAQERDIPPKNYADNFRYIPPADDARK
jgi:hypothetical protein